MILAKSNPEKELHEHTLEVMERAKREVSQFNSQGLAIDGNLEKAVMFCCFAHDLGKVSKTFQESLSGVKRYIPHNLISIAFLPSIFEKISFSDTWMNKIIYSVGFHHKNFLEMNDFISGSKRSGDNGLEDELIDIHLNRSHLLEPMTSLFKEHFKMEWTPKIDFSIIDKIQKIIFDLEPFNKELVCLKGILHRADHISSAGIDEDTKVYLNAEGYNRLTEHIKPKKFQKNLKGRDSLILIAPTGSGKTEAALCWAGSRKGKIIFTLPTRASVNAAFNKLKKYYGNDVGILHGEAGRFIYSTLKKEYGEAEAVEESIHEITLNKNLMKPVLVTTIDQIFSFALRVHQYEKVLMGLYGSNLILDEIDSYSPYTIEILKQSLKVAKDFNITPLIMSATIPDILQEEFTDVASEKYVPGWNDLEMKNDARHEITIINNDISECETIIKKLPENSSMLIVCNTIKKAVSVYEKLRTFSPKLYHSLFAFDDRENKEIEITKTDSTGKNVGIWITTQVVEVSLDLDFDVLITEAAPLNVLIQRMGRCYRKRQGAGKVFIYSKLINEGGKEMFFPYGEFAIKESLKVIVGKDIVDIKKKREMLNIYFKTFWSNKKVEADKERAKGIISAFLSSDLTMLETIGDNEVSRFLRDSGISLSAIPQSKLTDTEIDKLKGNYKWKDRIEKMVFLNEIKGKVLSVPLYSVLKYRSHFEETKYGLFLCKLEYNSDTGLNLRNLPSNFA
ncbi:MAG: CRISPR-associated helicase Cas3' [Nitrospirae bacterium]|nr:CRISPR-associated helicase Cas3' [Nitrospirota bacterium]